jgi:hypothetical protein
LSIIRSMGFSGAEDYPRQRGTASNGRATCRSQDSRTHCDAARRNREWMPRIAD